MIMNWMAIAALACLIGSLPSPSAAQGRPLAGPGMKVLLENECVRVLLHQIAVGHTVPMHSHPAYVGYVLKPFRAMVTLPDGTHRITVHKTGEAYWSGPTTHSVMNVGRNDIENLIVEIKPGGKCQ
jgi:hypothetical protein